MLTMNELSVSEAPAASSKTGTVRSSGAEPAPQRDSDFADIMNQQQEKDSDSAPIMNPQTAREETSRTENTAHREAVCGPQTKQTQDPDSQQDSTTDQELVLAGSGDFNQQTLPQPAVTVEPDRRLLAGTSIGSQEKPVLAMQKPGTADWQTGAVILNPAVNPAGSGEAEPGLQLHAASLHGTQESHDQEFFSAAYSRLLQSASLLSGKDLPPGGKRLSMEPLSIAAEGFSPDIGKAELINLRAVPVAALLPVTNSTGPELQPSQVLSPDTTQLGFPSLHSQGSASVQQTGIMTPGFSGPADGPQWQQLQQGIRWMNQQGLTQAELRLHPEELGSLEIRIIQEDDQTRVSFITSNAGARELIETSLPRLRELLGAQGLQLSHSDVSSQPGTGQDSRDDNRLPTTLQRQADDSQLLQNMMGPVQRSGTLYQIDHYV